VSTSDVQVPADVRAFIVRRLGAALADAWRRQHVVRDRDDGGDRRDADGGVSAPAVGGV
jgi:hypothetical protein